MDRVDFTTALGALLSNGELRRAFALNRRATAQRLGVCDDDMNAFLALDVNALQTQAEGLVNKRLSEVASLLPATFRIEPNAGAMFRRYAELHWPTGHRRHEEDALCFCDHLVGLGLNVCRAERNRVAFNVSQKRFGIFFVRDIPSPRGPRSGVQFFHKSKRGETRYFVVYLGI